MPPAAKITVSHACPAHAMNPQVTGSGDTLIGFLPAGRVGDTTACGAEITKGAATVFINHRMAARLGDPTGHGGILVSGHPNVLIGDTPQSFALGAAAGPGAPFCEECEKARRRLAEGKSIEPEDDDAPPEHHASEGASASHADGAHDDHAAKGASEPTGKLDEFAPKVGQSLRALAASPNAADGANPLRELARGSVATQFLFEHAKGASVAFIKTLTDQIDRTVPLHVLGPLVKGAPPSLRCGLHAGCDPLVFKAAIEHAIGPALGAVRPPAAIRSVAEFAAATESASELAKKIGATAPSLAGDIADALSGLSALPSEALHRSLGAPVPPALGQLGLEAIGMGHVDVGHALMEIDHARSRLTALPGR